METITLESARAAGFDPRAYSPFIRQERIRARVDFLAKMGADDNALFFRLESSGERFYARLDLEPTNEGIDKAVTLMPYLQRNDLCDIKVSSPLSTFCVREISLVKQEPLCAWREQCDQRSLCCVFKS